MAETTKSRQALLNQYPDNNAKLISAEDLRDLPVSIEIYGEIKRSTDSGQTLPNAGAVLQFDSDGLFARTTPDSGSDQIIIDHDGRYEITLKGTALIHDNRTFDIYLRINGINIEQIGRLRDSRDEDSDPNVCITCGTMIDLIQGDTVQIWVDPSSNNSRFRPTIGARLMVDRRLEDGSS